MPTQLIWFRNRRVLPIIFQRNPVSWRKCCEINPPPRGDRDPPGHDIITAEDILDRTDARALPETRFQSRSRSRSGAPALSVPQAYLSQPNQRFFVSPFVSLRKSCWIVNLNLHNFLTLFC
ncbi:hypothetical protein [Microseira wollei]|uniref:hypothetical protein n=1 Tax=Microseira wollei TaxID=467598 RepID=UPI001CFC4B4A|nr:hypothetical protein [Microseira wollei]